MVPVPSRAPALTRRMPVSVAAQTGEVIELTRREQLSRAFLGALDNFRTSYMLRYVPTGVEEGGGHNVTVQVKSKNRSIRARRSYSAPN